MRRLSRVVGSVVLGASVLVVSDGFATASPAPAASNAVVKSSTGSYVVVMRANPLIAAFGQDGLGTPAAARSAAAMTASHDQVLAAAGVDPSLKVHEFTNALNGFSARIGYDEAVRIAANPLVGLVLPDEMRYPTSTPSATESSDSATDDLGRYLGLTASGEAWKSGVTGEGVVIGVIDSGIWPEHPSFADDGTYSAHPPLDATVGNPCDFGNTAANPADAPFSCNNKLVGARQMLATYRALIGAAPGEYDSARDDDGHGTHTASTAGGNAKVSAVIDGQHRGVISGVAPRARIIAYKALGDLGGFASDLAAAIDQAVADGVDVINYSVGGGPSLLSPDAISMLFAAGAGVFTSVSASNDGPDPATIGGPADVPWVTTVGANTMPRSFRGTIDLDDGPKLHGASISGSTQEVALVDAENAGSSDLCLADSLVPAKVAGKIVLCRRGGNGRVAKGAEVHRAGGVGMVLYNQSDTDNLFTDNHWVPTVHLDYSDGIVVKQFIASTRSPAGEIEDTGKVRDISYAPSMTIFSSRGPNPSAPDVIKPDITAPGHQILAGASPTPDADSPPGHLFQAIAGTSMSAPVIAGEYALIKQVHPDWSAAMAKSALMTSANTRVKDNDRTSPAGPFAMGAGEGRVGQPDDTGSAFLPGLVYHAGFLDYLGFYCGSAPQIFGPDAEAICSDLAAAGIPSDPSDLNYPSIGVAELAGTKTITRTVTSVADKRVTYSAKVEAPAGYKVTVTPSKLTIKPGESKTFTVKIERTTAPLGVWAFGALTWRSGDYKVRSPIAVRGVAINVPAEILGTGATSTASVPVQFGYTGAYTAGVHGLVPATPHPGSVLQDPDQTIGSPDDGGGVVAVPIAVSSAAHLRLKLVVPGDADLDLYLVGPGGDLVAASTNGATDELIDLAVPADGTYTLLVHGWAVPIAPLAFTVESWIVPLATGGSLSATSAPTSAVSGGSGTVELAWSGLTPGAAYLGAVSHRDSAALLGVSLVSVQA